MTSIYPHLHAINDMYGTSTTQFFIVKDLTLSLTSSICKEIEVTNLIALMVWVVGGQHERVLQSKQRHRKASL